MRVRLDRGASTVEWGAVILLIAAIVGTLVLSDLPSAVGSGLRSAICTVNQGGDCDPGTGSGQAQPKTQGAPGQPAPGQPGQPAPGQPGQPAPGQPGQPTGPGAVPGQPGAGEQTPEQLAQQARTADEQATAADEEAEQAEEEADRKDREAGSAGDIAKDAIKEISGLADAERCIGGDVGACAWTGLTFIPFVGWAGRAAKAGKAAHRAKKLKKAYDAAKGVAAAARRRAAAARGRAGRARQQADQARDRYRQACGLPNSFVAGTLILLKGGKYKPIEDVDVGDQVYAADPLTRRAGTREVTQLISSQGSKQLVEVTVDVDGDAGSRTGTLTATDGHPFWLAGDRRWADAGSLRPGDELTTAAGDRVAVRATRAYGRTQRVYNFAVAGLHTYYVRAGAKTVLVHNTSAPQGCMPGATGAQHTSKTHYERGPVRLDTENPNPGQRPGQIHIQIQGKPGKYQWNFETRRFEPDLPASVANTLRSDKERWSNALNNALRAMGERPVKPR